MKQYVIGMGIEFDRDNNRLSVDDRESALKRIRHNAMIQFGGFTEIDVVGGWINPDGKAVREQGKQISLIVSDDKVKDVPSFAQYVAATLRQHSVVLINPCGKVGFIESNVPDQWDGSDIGESKPIYDGHG